MAGEDKNVDESTSVSREDLQALVEGTKVLLLDGEASSAIRYTSLLEEHLRIALCSKMPNMDRKMEGILFEGYGPLSTLRSKIDIALALDVLTEALHRDAQTVRKIRNKFAHSSKNLGLSSDTLVQLCRNLSTFDAGEKRLMKIFGAAIQKITDHLAEQIEVGLKEAKGRSSILAAALKQASADKAVVG
ncbi:hypothetical protein [Bradyrhizobium algeriense]|uniref:hypothetical protein n=1 Tax=Bradyrhizobium algeriense TaxID=634784 RepID=UPI000D3DA7F3|nr:hypothetical protein [Bradyrhizobium algeriense]